MKKYKQVAHNELERIAAETLVKYGKFDGKRLLVDELVEKLGYKIIAVEGLLDEFDVEAYIPKKPNTIIVDKTAMDHGFPRYYFTLAEEVAHTLIHLPMVGSLSELYDWISGMSETEYNRFEWDAKHLAGALLMPPDDFASTFKGHHAHHKLALGKIGDRHTINRLAVRKTYTRYGVSFEAAAVRARCLNLITSSDLVELRKYQSNIRLYGSSRSC